jgi:hypothetical protein
MNIQREHSRAEPARYRVMWVAKEQVGVQLIDAGGKCLGAVTGAAPGRCLTPARNRLGILSDVPLAVGEIVSLVLQAENTPAFVARVVWQQGRRIGLYCVASKSHT